MTETKPPKKAFKMELKVDESIGAGSYANLCIINHSDSEFVLDFAFIQPGRPKANVANRIVMSPKNAKRMMMLLQAQVKNFEKRFGALDITAPMIAPPEDTEVN